MARRGWFLTGFALLALAPAALQGQELTDAPASTLDEATVRTLATLQVELNVARDAFNSAIAAVHEGEAQQEVRDEFNNKRAEILARYGLTESEYRSEIFAVSTDGIGRALFDRFLKEAAEAAAPSAAPRAP
jgi:hypothetical protein